MPTSNDSLIKPLGTSLSHPFDKNLQPVHSTELAAAWCIGHSKLLNVLVDDERLFFFVYTTPERHLSGLAIYPFSTLSVCPNSFGKFSASNRNVYAKIKVLDLLVFISLIPKKIGLSYSNPPFKLAPSGMFVFDKTYRIAVG